MSMVALCVRAVMATLAMHAMVERYNAHVPILVVGLSMSGLFSQHKDPQLIYLLNDSGTNRHLDRDAGLLWRYTR